MILNSGDRFTLNPYFGVYTTINMPDSIVKELFVFKYSWIIEIFS